MKHNGQNQAQEWKEREKLRLKANTSLIGQPMVMIEESRLKIGERLKALDPSTPYYKRRPPHTELGCMSTRSTSSNLFSPLRDPESLIRLRNLGEPSSLFDFEEVMSIPHNNMGPPPAGPPPPNNGPPPVVRPNGQAPRSMEELCQPSIDGRGETIALIPIQATDFGLR
ncbi:hypothetical protein Tco_0816699 [Tanacetum coccineum]